MTCSLGAHLGDYRCLTVTLKFGGRVLQSLSPACYLIFLWVVFDSKIWDQACEAQHTGLCLNTDDEQVVKENLTWRVWVCHFVVQRDFWKVCSSMILWPALVTNPLENLCESQFIVSRKRKPSDHWGFQRSDFGSQGLESLTHALNIFKTKGYPLVKLVKPRPRPGNRQFLSMLW